MQKKCESRTTDKSRNNPKPGSTPTVKNHANPEAFLNQQHSLTKENVDPEARKNLKALLNIDAQSQKHANPNIIKIIKELTNPEPFIPPDNRISNFIYIYTFLTFI